MNVTRITPYVMNKLSNVRKAGSIGLLGAGLMMSSALVGCNKTGNQQQQVSKQSIEQAVNNKPQAGDTVEVKKPAPPTPIDLTKPNLPIIAGRKEIVGYTYVYWIEYAIFKDESGQQYITKITDPYVGQRFKGSLYKAIPKFSTPENPDITDVEGFREELEKQGLYSVYGFRRQQIKRKKALQNNFENMMYKYTCPESDRGKIITVREYTQMMQEWPYILSFY